MQPTEQMCEGYLCKHLGGLAKAGTKEECILLLVKELSPN